MLAHTKTLHTELEKGKILHVYNGDLEYAIPFDVIKKYAVKDPTKKKLSDDLIPADEFFKDLHEKYTKAGSLLRGLRGREGLTQVEFAKKINITQVNLSHMENGRRPIGKEIAARIAKVFKTNPNYFVSK